MKKIGRLVKTVITGPDNPRNGEGSFIRLRDGSIMLAYTRFGGEGGDHDRARLVGIVSRDEGESWSEAKELFADDRECRNNMGATLVRLPNGELGLCYLRKANRADIIDCMPVFRYSSDEGKSWSEMIMSTREPAYYCGTNAAPVVTAAGKLIVPVSWSGNHVHRYDLEPGVVRFFCSDDSGRSWKEDMKPIYSPYGDRAGLQEPGLLELPDGRLFCHMRTVYGFQYQSFSADGGQTWTVPEPAFLFPSPDSPMRITRFRSRTLAVSNPVTWSPALEYTTPWGSPPRTPLMLAVSDNGGASFALRAKDYSHAAAKEFKQNCYLLEDDPADQYCYPAMIDTKDGYLIAYYCDAGAHRVLNVTRIMKVTNDELA